jgi:excisionase family DNA binding protein
VTRLLVTRAEAAGMLGMSLRHFQRAVQPRLRLVRSGRCRLVPVAELERWVRENMDR